MSCIVVVYVLVGRCYAIWNINSRERRATHRSQLNRWRPWWNVWNTVFINGHAFRCTKLQSWSKVYGTPHYRPLFDDESGFFFPKLGPSPSPSLSLSTSPPPPPPYNVTSGVTLWAHWPNIVRGEGGGMVKLSTKAKCTMTFDQDCSFQACDWREIKKEGKNGYLQNVALDLKLGLPLLKKLVEKTTNDFSQGNAIQMFHVLPSDDSVVLVGVLHQRPIDRSNVFNESVRPYTDTAAELVSSSQLRSVVVSQSLQPTVVVYQISERK